MSITEIVDAAGQLAPDEFMKLRRELDKVEERLWKRELRRAGARHQKTKLTDARIDALVLRRRRAGRRS